MEQKITNKLTALLNSKTYGTLTKVIFPVCLILMSFYKVNKGIDISDSTYSPTNYLFLDNLDGMWYFSTFYANLLGGLLVKLPMGNTLLGLNIYTSLIKCVLAISAYLFFTYEVKIGKEISFIGSLVSVSLCWCPTTILYNYLTYLFFFWGACLLYSGIQRRMELLLFLAGLCLGCNFFVRLPNIAECALIIALWVSSLIKQERFLDALRKTLICIAGYICSLIIGFILVALTRGIGAYVSGITELFAMTSEASGYTTIGMILGILRAYRVTLIWFVPVISSLGIALIINYFFANRKNRLIKVIYVSIGIGMLIVLYKQGMFYHNFHTFESVYRLAAWILIFAIIFDFVFIVSKQDEDKKLLAVISLIVIGITPLGSNNDIYANLNNLFFVIPIFIYLVSYTAKNIHFTNGICYVVGTMFTLLTINAILFGLSYTFRDGAAEPLDTRINNNQVLNGMVTSEVNANRFAELTALYETYNLSDKSLLLYGNVSGLGFILNSDVCISTAWPSLDSFSTNKFARDIEELILKIEKKGREKPVVIIGAEEYDNIISPNTTKQEILKNFLDIYEYKLIYSNDMFYVLIID